MGTVFSGAMKCRLMILCGIAGLGFGLFLINMLTEWLFYTFLCLGIPFFLFALLVSEFWWYKLFQYAPMLIKSDEEVVTLMSGERAMKMGAILLVGVFMLALFYFFFPVMSEPLFKGVFETVLPGFYWAVSFGLSMALALFDFLIYRGKPVLQRAYEWIAKKTKA